MILNWNNCQTEPRAIRNQTTFPLNLISANLNRIQQQSYRKKSPPPPPWSQNYSILKKFTSRGKGFFQIKPEKYDFLCKPSCLNNSALRLGTNEITSANFAWESSIQILLVHKGSRVLEQDAFATIPTKSC